MLGHRCESLEEGLSQPCGGTMHCRVMNTAIVERRVAEGRLVERIHRRKAQNPRDDNPLFRPRSLALGVGGERHYFSSRLRARKAAFIRKAGISQSKQRAVARSRLREHR